MGKESFVWSKIFPVVLEVAADGEPHEVPDFVSAVSQVAQRDFPSHANRQLKHRSVVEDRTRWAIFHARHLGFLEDLALGVTRLTQEGRAWLKGNPYPLAEETRLELRRAARTERKSRVASKRSELEGSASEQTVDDFEDEEFFWVLRSGKDGEREQFCIENGVGAPGMYYGPEVEKATTLDEHKRALQATYPHDSTNRIANWASQANRFKNEMNVGDLVLMPSKLQKGFIYTGVVTGPAYVDESQTDVECRNLIPIEWNEEAISRDDLGEDLRSSLGSLLTIFKVARNEARERVELVIDGMGDPQRQDELPSKGDFELDWIPFFEELGQVLIKFRDRRSELLALLLEAKEKSDRPSFFRMLEQWSTTEGPKPATDIDPFTVYAIINRNITTANKIAVCSAYKDALGLETDVPKGFDGVPQKNNLRTRFDFKPKDVENPRYYDQLWDLFEVALDLELDGALDSRNAAFSVAFDKLIDERPKAEFTMGLFWMRPSVFVPLDGKTRQFLSSPDGMGIDLFNDISNGRGYLEFIREVHTWLKETEIDPQTVAGLSATAYLYEPNKNETEAETAEVVVDLEDEVMLKYGTNNIVGDGAFLSKERLDGIIERWRAKKNIILQGPPGTGKTWLARRLAYALIGKENSENVTAIQFHPSTSYEDIVQGYRPGSNGTLQLQDGPLKATAQRALENEAEVFVLLIEEINRGNPAQIFGEMLTLMEADKRNPGSALRPIYDDSEEGFFLPPNLYIIGTMNQADRSLATMDMALRRRFAFIDLEPEFGQPWLDFSAEKCTLNRDALAVISNRMTKINEMIEADPTLGEASRIGHSVVTPRGSDSAKDEQATMRWFSRIAKTEILPQLREYWFDRPEQLNTAKSIVLGDG